MPKKMRARPRLFVGSSAESLDFAYAIQQNLEDDAEVTVWKQGVFELTKSTVESLVKSLDKSDFAVFVFAPNDALRLRQKKYSAVRDNVIFELGLFMGKLGRSRTFVVIPKRSRDLRIPTDLLGVAMGSFEPKRRDKNLEAALGPFCNQVRGRIRRHGRRVARKHLSGPKASKPRKGNLVVIDAAYGAQDRRFDVTKILNSAIIDGKLHIRAGNDLAGDPCPDASKDLVVRYRHRNQEHTRTVDAGADLDLP